MIREELIGKIAVVIESTNPNDIKIKGKIVDETKNTIKIRDEKTKEEKILFKKNIVIRIGGYKIKGSALLKRPEERIKIKVKK